MSGEKPTTASAEIRRVLIMDDHKDCADALATILRRAGHEVHVAYDAETALKLAERQRPNVFLLDLGLPELDGFTVAVNLRHRFKFNEALFVAVTGYGTPADRARASAAGFNMHLTKPIDGFKVLEILRGKPAESF